MSFAIEIHHGWRNLRESAPPAPPRDADDEGFARAFRQLKPRQQEILRCRAEGMTGGEIGHYLFRGYKLIKNELTAIYKVLGVGGSCSAHRISYLLGRMDGANDG